MYSLTAEPRTIVNFLRLSFDWNFHPDRFFAEYSLSLFPLVIIWPLAWVISWRNRSIRWWTCWALAYTLFWFRGPQYLRYWLPALPLTILALCESIGWVMERISKAVMFQRAVWLALILWGVFWSVSILGATSISSGWPPVDSPEREEFLTRLGGYKAVAYINKNADEREAVYVINASWLNYYLKPRAIDYVGLVQQSHWPSFRWPDDAQWMQRLEAQNVKWILIGFANLPAPMKIPDQNPVNYPFWPGYQLVYADAQMWVFRHK